MKKQFRILAMVFLSLFVVSCDDDNDNDPQCCVGNSIVDLASQTESLSTLVAALQATGLDADEKPIFVNSSISISTASWSR